MILNTRDVRNLPGPELAHVPGGTWIYPLYRRLAMGSSHSVHILMCANLEITGRGIFRYILRRGGGGELASEDQGWLSYLASLWKQQSGLGLGRKPHRPSGQFPLGLCPARARTRS